MLEIRPNCELCDKDLAPDSAEACICTYECTFCADCVANLLRNVCPNCGGGFTPRPIRPRGEYRDGVGLENHPPSQRRVHSVYGIEEIQRFSATLSDIAPEQR